MLVRSRGGVKADEEFLIEALLRLAQLALDWPALAQIDINPLIVTSSRATSFIVDARVRVQP